MTPLSNPFLAEQQELPFGAETRTGDEFSYITPVPASSPGRKAASVPESVVKLAQAALDGLHYDGGITHTGKHRFEAGQEERRDRFVKAMRNAGAHTNPPCSVSVVTGPRDGDHLTVTWTAGKRRGARGAGAPAGNDVS